MFTRLSLGFVVSILKTCFNMIGLKIFKGKHLEKEAGIFIENFSTLVIT